MAKDKQGCTPGPWRVEPTQYNHGQTTCITGGDAVRLADINSPTAWQDAPPKRGKQAREDWYNVRLMAAAPEMRALLDDITGYFSRVGQEIDAIEQARALLARIDGQR